MQRTGSSLRRIDQTPVSIIMKLPTKGVLKFTAAGRSSRCYGRLDARSARRLLFWALLLALGLTARATAQASDPRSQLYDGEDGATCAYFNAGGRIPWRHALGDWVDADGQSQGEKPFATAAVEAGGAFTVIEWDLTRVVHGWLSGTYPNTGILLAAIGAPSGTAVFASREVGLEQLRPRLTVHRAGRAKPETLVPTADATLDCSTRRSLGANGELHVGAGTRVAMQFDLAALAGRSIVRASLKLTTLTKQSSPVSIGVFRLDPPVTVAAARSHAGIAGNYRDDRGIDQDPDVLMATGFESPSWRAAWSYVSARSHVDVVARDEARRFEPFLGKALRVEIPKGDNFGLDMGFDFKDKLGYEPEEVYFRYYLRLADDWIPTVDGGKLPGLAGTYGKAGWGGRRADPLTGWSMRGSFNRAPSPANPLYGQTAISTYAYHAEMEDKFGDQWYWTRDGLGLLQRNRWYCLEQYFRVNAPGSRDGMLRAWIDGALAFEKTDVYVRDADSLKIERVWMDVYHGGTATAARDLHLYIDNVVVARKPIGCIGGR
jgi:hypothetical protein